MAETKATVESVMNKICTQICRHEYVYKHYGLPDSELEKVCKLCSVRTDIQKLTQENDV